MATRDYDWSVEEHESLSSMRERLATEGPTYLAHVREVVRPGPPRRHVRRRAVRAGRGVHLRRDDRPRAHLRRAPPDARRAGPRHSTASRTSAGATRCAGWREPRLTTRCDRLRPAGRMAAWRSPFCSSPWPSPCSRHGAGRPASTFPAPLLLIAVGVAASYLPGVPEVHLEPEVVLLGLLPPLLYAAAIQTSLVDFNANRRAILLLSVGLVVVHDRSASASLVHALLPGISLGARVRDRRGRRAAGRRRRDRDRPPDRAAAADRDDPRGRVAAQRRHRAGRAAHRASPRPSAAVDDRGRSALDFLRRRRRRRRWSASSSSSWSARLRKHVTDPVLDTAISFVIPFAAYIVAEEIHASGVIAVVVAGPAARPQGADPADRAVADRRADELAHHRLRPREHRLPADRPAGRTGSSATSATATLSAGRIVARLRRDPGRRSIVLRHGLGVRRPLPAGPPGPRPATSATTPPWTFTFVLGWAGMRGVVTLAAAFVIPEETDAPRGAAADRVHRRGRHAVHPGPLAAAGWPAGCGCPSPDPMEDALARATLLQQASKAGLRGARRAGVRRPARRRRR